MKQKVIVILGPTASGKSKLAVKIALRLRSGQAKKFGIKGAEIISVDSRQVYRGLDIGTAKPTKTEMKKIKHHLIDVKSPDEEYTVRHYKEDCLSAIRKIIRKNRLPILVGGSGLYLKAVTENIEIPKVKPDKKLRQRLEEKMKAEGRESLYQKLIELDPEAAYIVDAKNPRRIIRALEVIIKTRKPFSQQRKKGEKLFDALKIGIRLPKKELRKRINRRVDLMMKRGLLGEVRKLISRYSPSNQVFDAIGYREIIDYLEGKLSLETAVTLIKKNTRQFARRQMTWFKKDEKIKWTKDDETAMCLIKDFLAAQ